MWNTLGEIEGNKRKALCVESKNLSEMFDKAKACLPDSREGFEAIKHSSKRFPLIKLFYVNRRWNKEADCSAKFGLKRNTLIKKWY